MKKVTEGYECGYEWAQSALMSDEPEKVCDEAFRTESRAQNYGDLHLRTYLQDWSEGALDAVNEHLTPHMLGLDTEYETARPTKTFPN